MKTWNIKFGIIGGCIGIAISLVFAMCSLAYGNPIVEGKNTTNSSNKASSDISICQDLSEQVDTDGDNIPDSPSLEGVVTVPAKILAIIQKDGKIQYPTSGMEVINTSAYTIHLSSLDYTDAGSGLELIQKTIDDLSKSTYWTQMTMDGVSGPQNFDMKLMSAKSTLTKDRVFVGDKAINIDDSKSFTMDGKANTKGTLIPTSLESPLKIGTLSWWFGAGPYTERNIVKLQDANIVDYTDVTGTEVTNFSAKKGTEVIIYANSKDRGKTITKLTDTEGNVYLPTDENKFIIAVNKDLILTPTVELIVKEHLDNYTIDDLKAASLDLEVNGMNSPFYTKFNEFMTNDEIWWCNSNCQQPKTCTKDDSSTFDVSKANHDYICNYTRDNDESNVDNYPMMRVIGVLHDYKAGTTKTTKEKAGLTFQYIHSVHYASQQGQKEASWWGNKNCLLRNTLQRGGLIYEETSPEITSQIQAVDKWYQENDIPSEIVNICICQDEMFIPSYSELWNTNKSSDMEYSTYDNKESFDAFGNPKSEGYVYEWANLHNINGGNNPNTILRKLGCTNNNKTPEKDGDGRQTPKSYSWLRTVHYNYNCIWFLVDGTGIISFGDNYDSWFGIAPCFCI